MKKTIAVIIAVALFAPGIHCFAQSAGTAAVIQYGTVHSAGTVKKDAKHAGGAAVGGLAAMAFAGPRHRPLKVLASTAAGAAIQGAATSGTLQQYIVKLLSGTEIKVSTEQQNIRVGDCVAVEKGQHVNIRHVGMVHCEVDYKPKPPVHHQANADECQVAKEQLANAQSEKEVDLAVKKVRILCEH